MGGAGRRFKAAESQTIANRDDERYSQCRRVRQRRGQLPPSLHPARHRPPSRFDGRETLAVNIAAARSAGYVAMSIEVARSRYEISPLDRVIDRIAAGSGR